MILTWTSSPLYRETSSLSWKVAVSAMQAEIRTECIDRCTRTRETIGRKDVEDHSKRAFEPKLQGLRPHEQSPR